MLARLMQKRPALRPTLRYWSLAAAIIAAAAILALDQLTKYLVVVAMDLRNQGTIDVFPGLSFRMAWNTGVNFGILSGGGEITRWILAIATFIAALVMIVSSLACKRMLSAIGLGVAAGGAIGNSIDRLNWGAVADFLNVSCCGIDNPWSFNVADIAIFLGFGLLLLPPLRGKRDGKSAPQSPAGASRP
jgi:signal peptidase II